jgi:hypothetical protein
MLAPSADRESYGDSLFEDIDPKLLDCLDKPRSIEPQHKHNASLPPNVPGIEDTLFKRFRRGKLPVTDFTGPGYCNFKVDATAVTGLTRSSTCKDQNKYGS